jgi:hypothetical protein
MVVWGLLLVSPGISGAQSPVSREQEKPTASQTYAGDKACFACHKEVAETYSHTAHHLTSSLPSERSINGKFTAGSNILRTSNQFLHYEMSATKDGYFESAIEDVSSTKKISHTERIDVVIGSGRKGQTYLYWKGDQLFELPVTYWTESNSWINSPGYPDGSPRFDKGVVPRCLECHGTSFKWIPPPANRYVKTSLVLGITCEKCHGPGSEHVARYKAKPYPAQGESKEIINPASFSRDRQVDACALCHAGVAEAIGPPLSFIPGEAIDQYLYIPFAAPNAKVDVHGNQVQLLKESKCYRSSSMTCNTCHDVHQRQRDAASFSAHCLTCHKAEDCGEHAKMGAQIAKNCVDCHMPLQESEVLVSDTHGHEIKPLVRNHRIAIYTHSNRARDNQ